MKKFVRRYLRPVAAPLSYIEEKPYHFATWALVAVILGLSGVWLPTLLAAVRGTSMCDFLFNSVNGGALAAFSVVLLADGIATAIVADKNISEKQPDASRPTATGIRGMITVAAIILVVVQVGVMGIVQPMLHASYFTYDFEILVTWAAIILACYLYCFRSEKWEQVIEDAAATVAKENEEVSDLSDEASARQSDGGGTKI
jgi:Ca2+/Na+ antiporter